MRLLRLLGIGRSYKATKANEGQRWAVLWNPEAVSAFRRKPVWREGVIEDVNESGFVLRFDSGASMICRTLKNLKQIN